jgi:hypothetical protein
MTIFTGGQRERTTKNIEEFSVSGGQVQRAFESEAVRFSPVPSIYRGVEQFLSQRDETSPILDVEAQEERIKEMGVPLKPEEGLRKSTLELLIERKQRELADKSVIERASTGQFIAGIGAGFVVAAFDPINVASAFMPIGRASQLAAALASKTSRTGRALTRARIGGLQGLAGAAVVEPFVAFQATNEQADYTMTDTLMNLAFGTALGGGLHSGIGVISDGITGAHLPKVGEGEVPQRLSKLSPRVRGDILKANLASNVEDRVGLPLVNILDLVEQPELAQVGITDPGTTIKGKFRFSEQTIITNEVIPPDIEGIARDANPQLFDTLDDIRAEEASIKQQLERVSEDRKTSDAVVKIDEEIAALQEQRIGLTKRKVKKLDAKIEALEKKRDALISEETPVMQGLRFKLQTIDEAKRDIAPNVAQELSRVEQSERYVTRFGQEQKRVDRRAKGISFDRVELERLQSVQNLRMADVEIAAQVDRELAPRSSFDTVADAEDSLKEQTSRLDEVIAQTDEALSDELIAIKDSEMAAVEAEIAVDDAYAEGLRVRTLCELGVG